MRTPSVSDISNYRTRLGTTTPTRIYDGNSDLTAFTEAIQAYIGEGTITVRASGYAAESASIEGMDVEGVDIEGVAKAILRSQQTEYSTYEFIEPESEEVTFVRTFYGKVPTAFFLSMGNKGFLKIGDKYIIMRK